MKRALSASVMVIVLAAVIATAGTAAKRDAPTVAVANGHFTFNGVPTFLVMARAFSACPSPDVVNANAGLGVFIMDHSDWPCSGVQDPSDWASRLEGTLGSQMYWLEREPSDASALAEMPQLVDWQGEALDTALEANPAAQLNCTGSSTAPLFNAIRKESNSGPVIYEIFLVDNCLTAPVVSRVITTAAYAGASGIYLITQRATAPDEMVGMPPEVATATTRALAEVKSVQAALLSPKVPVKSTGPVKVTAHRYRGKTYYFAVNTGSKSSRCVIAMKGKKAQVLSEHRALKIVSGKLSDNKCAGGSHHVYVVP